MSGGIDLSYDALKEKIREEYTIHDDIIHRLDLQENGVMTPLICFKFHEELKRTLDGKPGHYCIMYIGMGEHMIARNNNGTIEFIVDETGETDITSFVDNFTKLV